MRLYRSYEGLKIQQGETVCSHVQRYIPLKTLMEITACKRMQAGAALSDLTDLIFVMRGSEVQFLSTAPFFKKLISNSILIQLLYLSGLGLICRDCNTQLDSLADNALIEAFGIWPTLLDIKRQGKNAPKQTITQQGHRVRVEPNGKITRTDVDYKAVPVAGGEEITIAAPDMKTLKQVAGRAKKQHPHLDINTVLQQAAVVSVETNPPIKCTNQDSV